MCRSRPRTGSCRRCAGLSFQVDAGQTLGIVGESGSGKSVSTQTIMGLTRGARISGRAMFEGRDLLTMDREELQTIRGAQIGMIFQDPLSSLHPYYRVGWQIVEMIRQHDRQHLEGEGTRQGGGTAHAWWASRRRTGGWTTTPTSSRAACGSGR